MQTDREIGQKTIFSVIFLTGMDRWTSNTERQTVIRRNKQTDKQVDKHADRQRKRNKIKEIGLVTIFSVIFYNCKVIFSKICITYPIFLV